MSELDNLIGSKISLFSEKDIRYVGELFSIDTENSALVLKDVQCFGTEGRVTGTEMTVTVDAGHSPLPRAIYSPLPSNPFTATTIDHYRHCKFSPDTPTRSRPDSPRQHQGARVRLLPRASD
jgi:hypothetical protein